MPSKYVIEDLSKEIFDRKEADIKITEKIYKESLERTKNDSEISKKIDDDNLGVHKKLSNMSIEVSENNLKHAKLNYNLKNEIRELKREINTYNVTLTPPEIDIPKIKIRRLCDCSDNIMVDFNTIPAGTSWFGLNPAQNPFKIKSTTGEELIYTIESPYGGSFSASSMVITTNDTCENQMDNTIKLALYNSTLNIYDFALMKFEVKCICFDYCQLNGQATIFLNGLAVSGRLMSDLDGTSIGGIQISVNHDTFDEENLKEHGTVEIKGKNCNSIKNISIWVANYFLLDNIKYCLCDEKEPEPEKDKCECDEGDRRFSTGINDTSLTIPSTYYSGDSFDVKDDFYVSNKFIFHFCVENSPVIFGITKPTNHVTISQTACGRPSRTLPAPELNVNNSTLVLFNIIKYPEMTKAEVGLKRLCFDYCELGGINALIIDGVVLECSDFSLLDGKIVGTTTISVTESIIPGTISDKRGQVIISNDNCFRKVGVYGQELYVDNVEYCIGKCKKIPTTEGILAGTTSTIKLNDETKNFTISKVEKNNEILSEYKDELGNNVSETEFLDYVDRQKKEVYKYGKIHPDLGKYLETVGSNGIVIAKIWTKDSSSNDFMAKLMFSKNYQLFMRKQRHLNIPNNDNYNTITEKFLQTAEGNKLHEQMINSDFKIKVLTICSTKKEILRLAEENDTLGIFLRNDTYVEDINNQKNDTNATTIVDVEGWRGTNLRACVFEGSPGDTATLSGFDEINDNTDADGQKSGIQEAYDIDNFPGPKSHAVSCTAIITNRASNVNERGYAPDSLIYSANDYSLEALTWAVQEKKCRVVNQSFHRSNEWSSTVPQEDDIYKDYLALKYPYPFITTASGNWSSTSESEPGGVDGSNEIVNHKSYNCVTVGNVNDFVGGEPNGMRGSSVWKNPDSTYGDWELPEICANGVSVSYNGEARGSGTSFSSPAVAGTALLLQNADNLLLYWPEGIRAILFAGAIKNVKDSTWYSDVINNVDGYDGCGCMDTEESMRITLKSFNSGKQNENNIPKPRGWDVGTLSDSDFLSKKYVSYFIGVPNVDPTGNGSKTSRIKVALAWNSKISTEDGEPISSNLNLDHDLYLFNEAGVRVAHSCSWDNPYEVIDFEGIRGAIYEIRIRRFSGSGSSWYGIAWTSGDGSFLRLTKTPIEFPFHTITNIESTSDIQLGVDFRDVNYEEIWRNTMLNKKLLIDSDNIFELLSVSSNNVELKYNINNLESIIQNEIKQNNKQLIIVKLDKKNNVWVPQDSSISDDKIIFKASEPGTYSFAIED